jgi:plastocyanin
MTNRFRRSTKRAAVAPLLLLAALVTFTGLAASQKASHPKTHVVRVQGMKFIPANLEVTVGDTVVWKNEDIVAHTATSDSEGFDSGEIKPGMSWKYVAGKRGSYPYICAYHPTMKAELTVR